MNWGRLLVTLAAVLAAAVAGNVFIGREAQQWVVLAGNKAWNVLWFGRRTLWGGFFGCVVFLVPLLALEVAVLEDAVSALVLALYVLWVGYDLVWLYQMWRLNEA